MANLELARRPGDALATTKPPGFLAGLGCLFGGFGFLVTQPATWPLALVPVAIGSALGGALSWSVVHWVPGYVHAIVGAGWLGSVAAVAFTALGVLLSFVLGLALAQPLSGFALNRIVRRAEALEGAPTWPETGAIDDILRGLGSVVVSFAFGAPLLALLFLLSFTPVAPVAFVLKLVVLALTVAWDLCDYPLSLRGWTIGARVSFMKRHAGAMVGFGFGVALLSLLPCAYLFILPAGVAGAARLVARLEKSDRAAGFQRAG